MAGGELIRRLGAVARRPAGQVDRPTSEPAVSTATVAFASRVWTWADVPAPIARAAARRSRMLAEAAHLGDVVLDPVGRATQELRAWRVQLDALTVLTLQRPVLPGPAGMIAPTGDWQRHRLDVLPVDGVPKRRTGVVPDDAHEERGAPGRAESGTQPEHRSGNIAASHLPGVVRAGVERLVPTPVWLLGTVVQASDPDGLPIRQDLTVLRADERRAVVVRAHRELVPVLGLDADGIARVMARIPWHVDQLRVELRPQDEHPRLRR